MVLFDYQGDIPRGTLRSAEIAILFDGPDALDPDFSQGATGTRDDAGDAHDIPDPDTHFLQGLRDLLNVGALIILYCGYEVHRCKDTIKNVMHIGLRQCPMPAMRGARPVA